MGRPAILTKAILEEHYVRLQKPGWQVAQEFGVSQSCFSASMKRCGIKARKGGFTPGAKQASFAARFAGCGEISGYHICTIKRSAKVRNIAFSLTPEYLWDLFLRQGRKCALTGVVIGFPPTNVKCDRKVFSTASLDRIDPKGDYAEGNVRWLHKHVNKMRTYYRDDEFVEWCCRVADYSRKEKN